MIAESVVCIHMKVRDSGPCARQSSPKCFIGGAQAIVCRKHKDRARRDLRRQRAKIPDLGIRLRFALQRRGRSSGKRGIIGRIRLSPKIAGTSPAALEREAKANSEVWN